MPTSQGPLVRIKAHPAVVTRGGCYRVLIRRITPGPNQGRWEPISRDSYTIVCPTKLEASELVFMVGGKFFPRPVALANDGEQDDLGYLNWLLRHYLSIEAIPEAEVGWFDERGVDVRRHQMLFYAWVRGWHPSTEELLGGAGAASMVAAGLDHIWRGR